MRKKQISSILRKNVQDFIRSRNSERKFGRFWSEFWLSHVAPNSVFRLWYILPFNGQARRLFNIQVIAFLFRPTCAIETGTYFASSTYVFLGMPSIQKVYSIESNSASFAVAKERFKSSYQDNRIEFLLGDSKIELKKVLESIDSENERVLCYLDAHWEGDIPTKDELRALLDWGGDWIAIIDDFQIPRFEGYGFDRYGQEVVGIGIVTDFSEIDILVPNESATFETGARRGTGYMIGGRNREKYLQSLVAHLNVEKIN